MGLLGGGVLVQPPEGEAIRVQNAGSNVSDVH